MAASLFNDILLRGIRSGQVPARTDAARKWYRDTAQKSVKNGPINAGRVERELKDRGANTSAVGNMYFFAYEAKHAKTLPYYDKFPLIFPIGPAPKGFMGINMHYLPPILRAKLMDGLYDTITNDKYDTSTKLDLSYKLLNSASKFREFKPTIKHYLNAQTRSRFFYVNPVEWDIALFLPTANFVGASKNKVYADSRKIIRNG
jgi:hypothetical protein